MKTKNNHVWFAVVLGITLSLGTFSSLLFGHEVFILDPIRPGKNYSYQFKEKSFEEPQWKYFHGTMPDGLELDQSGTLHGRVIGTPEKLKGKHYTFWVKAWEKDNASDVSTYKVQMKVKIGDKDLQPKPKEVWNKNQGLRFIAGYEMTRASSSRSEQKAFIDFFVSRPILTRSTDSQKPWRRLSAWGNVRLTSVPNQNPKSIGELPSAYFSDLTSLKLDEIASAAEFLAGLEYTLGDLFIQTAKRKYTMGLTISAGATLPFNSSKDKDSIPIYKLPPDLKEVHPDKEYLAFVAPDINRFYRQYYLGLRLKTFKTDSSDFPSMLDLMFGINDAVSGGSKKFSDRAVVRLDGFLPFNIKGIPIYIFGTVVLKTSKRKVETPRFFEPANPDEKVPITAPNVLTRALPENSRDYYRIGIGIELSGLFKKK